MTEAVIAGAAATMSIASLAAAVSVRQEARREHRSDQARGGTTLGELDGRVLSLGGGVLGGIVGWASAGIIGVVIVGGGGAFASALIPRRRRAQRAALLETQTIDMVTAVAAAIRAGHSVERSIAMAAEELDGPLGPLVAEVSDRAALGVPFEDSIERWSNEVGSAEARLVAAVLRSHRRSGGTLARPLEDLAATLRARRDGARELRSLTAQARLSAAILGLLPLGFFLFLSVVSRRDIEEAIRTPAGGTAVGVGLALQAAAFVWIRTILRVDDA